MPPRSNPTNAHGYTKNDYQGRPTTLCAGCGHNAISNQIVQTTWEMDIEHHRILKMSGIGCSSKSPAYFLGKSHGFNALHGRMPSVATGALTANRTLMCVAVSGDGDTGSIGLGQFKHVIRRNVPFVYIIENNGVYGLTKGQFSATAEEGLTLKYYGENQMRPIDLALEAVVGGATFVARSFSGDKNQVHALLTAALRHRGTAVLDIISPCVTFNNKETSLKSFPYATKNNIPLHDITVRAREELDADEADYLEKLLGHQLAPDFVETQDEIPAEYDEGQEYPVKMHDGTWIRLQKLDQGHNPRHKMEAIGVLERSARENKFYTGLIYYEEPRPTLVDVEDLVETPLSLLPDEQLRPSREQLEAVMAGYR